MLLFSTNKKNTMKKILFLIVLSAIFAFAGCKKTTVMSLDRAGVKPGSGIAAMFGSGNVEYETYGDSVYFRSGSEYQVFVPKKNGTLFYYKHQKKNGESYECFIDKSECVTKDELGVIYDREHFGYDLRKNQDKLEVKLQGLYKKAKAECKE